jgi:hypothetical protein
MNVLVILALAIWAALAAFVWALVHVGSRDDPEEWDR